MNAIVHEHSVELIRLPEIEHTLLRLDANGAIGAFYYIVSHDAVRYDRAKDMLSASFAEAQCVARAAASSTRKVRDRAMVAEHALDAYARGYVVAYVEGDPVTKNPLPRSNRSWAFIEGERAGYAQRVADIAAGTFRKALPGERGRSSKYPAADRLSKAWSANGVPSALQKVIDETLPVLRGRAVA